MKKVIIALALCLVIIAVLAVPVMAAPRTLTFSTFITSDGSKLPGSLPGHFTITTNGVPGVPAMHTLGLIDTKANPQLANGNYAFKLNADTAQQSALTSYFAAKGWPQAWLDQINAEIAGTSPFFYLNASGGNYTLVDGFKYGLWGVSAPLMIDDDYPVGTYVYNGTLTGSNGATLDVTVTLRVKLHD